MDAGILNGGISECSTTAADLGSSGRKGAPG